MQWYYAEKDLSQQGPISDEEITALLTRKTINAETKVWNETLPAWQKLSESSLASQLSTIRYAPPVEVPPVVPTPPPLDIPPVNPITPPPLSSVNWFYMQGAERKGPVSEEEIGSLIAAGILQATTQVWNSSFTTWQPLSATSLAKFSGPSPAAAEVVSVSSVNNIRVWVLAFLPLVGMMHDPYAWIVNLALNLAVTYRDSSQLAKAGYNTAALGSAWLIPVYLWKRAIFLKQNNAYFWVWCAIFLLSLGY